MRPDLAMNIRQDSPLYSLMLLSAAVIWGSSFFMVKDITGVLPVDFILAVRFIVGAVILALVFFTRLRVHLDRRHLLHGALLGVFLFGGYWFQTIGITDTTPSKNAFLTSVYCVLVPFVVWIIDRTRPDRYNFAAAFIMLIGIGFISLSGDLSMGFGDAMTLIGAVFYALHVTCIGRFSRTDDPVTLTVIQLGVAGVLASVLSSFLETTPASASWGVGVWAGMLYLTIMCTVICYLLQNVGQKHVGASTAAILLSLESVFGTLFSIIFYGDVLTLRVVVGFALVFCAVIISETKLSFLRRV